MVFIGRAQEKTTVFRTEKRRHPDGVTYPWIVKTTGVVNQYYFYCVDDDFGPFFIKFCSYFPYNAKDLHQRTSLGAAAGGESGDRLLPRWTTRSPRSTTRPRCRRSATVSGPAQIQALADKWLAILPNPFTERDIDAGYRYDVSMLQVEFSLTQMLDNPVSGRVFFEEVIRENLDVGRPDLVSLIFDRGLKRSGPRATPGRFRTRVITDGVTPSLHADYKNTTIEAIPQARESPSDRDHHQ